MSEARPFRSARAAAGPDASGAGDLGPLWLASRSPRRRLLLEQAGAHVVVHPPGIDDGVLRHGRVRPEHWVMALAYLKVRWVADALAADAPSADGPGGPPVGIVLGADTVCVAGGQVLGQPRDAADARGMLEALCGGDHDTITGVCILSRDDRRRVLFADRARVRVGDLDEATMIDYLASGEWRGKAGAYNLEDRLAAGWPIVCDGDPATVMGLPMRRLAPLLARIGRPGSPPVIGAVYLEPRFSIVAAITVAAGLGLYWMRLARADVPPMRRRVRRLSIVIMLASLPNFVRGLSFLDVELDVDKHDFVLSWTISLVLVLAVLAIAIADMLVTWHIQLRVFRSDMTEAGQAIVRAAREHDAAVERGGAAAPDDVPPGDGGATER